MHIPIGGEVIATKRRKYRNKPVEADGIKFDSHDEFHRYLELRMLERNCKIFDLKCHVSFDLIPAQVIDGRKVRPLRIVPDFVYFDLDGNKVVEDVKGGKGAITRAFSIKRRLMLERHGLLIRIIET